MLGKSLLANFLLGRAEMALSKSRNSCFEQKCNHDNKTRCTFHCRIWPTKMEEAHAPGTKHISVQVLVIEPEHVGNEWIELLVKAGITLRDFIVEVCEAIGEDTGWTADRGVQKHASIYRGAGKVTSGRPIAKEDLRSKLAETTWAADSKLNDTEVKLCSH